MKNHNKYNASVKHARLPILLMIICIVLILNSCTGVKKQPVQSYDVIIRHGNIIDGTGSEAYLGDVGIIGDKISTIGNLTKNSGKVEIDAKGLVVAPGFINMLSWAVESLIEDGHSQSDIRQGVTLEVFGEGWSMGPLNDKMKKESKKDQSDIKFDIEWTTLGEYLDFLVKKGISPNIASFVGATTLRIHTVGYEDREPTTGELETMKSLVKQAMEEGALGIGSSLIYAPAFYSSTEELIELCKVAAQYNGMYISHMRSEGNQILNSIDELLTIAKQANIRAEIYHLKQAGKENWNKYDAIIKIIEAARSQGLNITANMYNYTAGATGLDASMPPWVQEGGYDEWSKRLQNPAIRKKVIEEMKQPSKDWENLYYSAGSPEKLLFIGFKNEKLKHFTGMTLAEVSKKLNKSPEDTIIDLVIEDGSRVGTVYFLMSEENVRKQIALPWMSFGSDAESSAPEGVFLKSSTHPRAYGNVARLLGKYVRDEKIITLEQAIHKLTQLPANNLKIKNRGELKADYFADVVIFDPDKIQDHATFNKPLTFSTGMSHVFVNGTQVLKNGKHTGATPGQVVRGPGWVKNKPIK